ncbi:hypothetical protein [Algoriphagus boritolerans]|uniref:hypothetical protein n=1 Tax=Algoriphagus boritolerans TaxID=308111 RepID=UPI002FCE3179
MNYIIDIIGGEVAIGHSYTRGGDFPEVNSVPIGLLGADYEIVNGNYRIKKNLFRRKLEPQSQSTACPAGSNGKSG